MEPIVIVTAVAVAYYTGVALVDALRDLQREKGKYFMRPEPVKVRCRQHAYNERSMTTRNRW